MLNPSYLLKKVPQKAEITLFPSSTNKSTKTTTNPNSLYLLWAYGRDWSELKKEIREFNSSHLTPDNDSGTARLWRQWKQTDLKRGSQGAQRDCAREGGGDTGLGLVVSNTQTRRERKENERTNSTCSGRPVRWEKGERNGEGSSRPCRGPKLTARREGQQSRRHFAMFLYFLIFFTSLF